MKKTRDRPTLTWHIALALFCIVVDLLILTAMTVPFWFGWPDGAGTFGDMFGAANALFSGLAFLGVIIAILLQRNELALQREELALTREELALTRKELKGQREQLEHQVAAMHSQAFEATFFRMLELHHRIVDGVTLHKYSKVGRECFAHFYEYVTQLLEGRLGPPGQSLRDLSQNAVAAAYDSFYDNYGDHVGHYFRNLYNIVKFVDASTVEDKRLYTNLLRAQLSSSELALMFYNCLTPRGIKFKQLVERYTLLNNLEPSMLGDTSYIAWYDGDAFTRPDGQ